MDKGSSTIPFSMLLLIFFIASVATATFYYNQIKEEKVGYNALIALSLINKAENELIYLDLIARYSAYEASQDLLSKFYNKNCSKVDNYILLDSTCPFDYNKISESFNSFFKANLKSYITNTPYKFKDDYEITSAFANTLIVEGKANYFIKYEEGNVTYTIYPNFKQEINLDLSFLSQIIAAVIEKSSCLKKASFNELLDSKDKLAKECGFSANFEWSIKKKDNTAFFDIKIPKNNLVVKFAISLG